MCGICGMTGEKVEESEILKRMMDKMHHRGPDGEGTYYSEHAALGFKRLSIIDLDHGDQPMYNEDDSLILVFNGEIYNYKELVEELTAKGHKFRNRSDSECLLHAYEEYGKKMVHHLRGMFAFAIWDEKEETLFAARDFFGIKPFYYFRGEDGAFVFASEIKCLLEHPECPKEVNEKALDYYLSFQYSVLEETLFKGIFKLMPGCCLTWKNGEIQIECYQKKELQPSARTGGKAKLQELKDVLEDSVAAHLNSDVEVGVLLSAGVDSNYIMSRSRVRKSFSVGFEEGDGSYSELEEIHKGQEKSRGVNYQKVISAEEYWEVLPKVMYYMDEPLADPAAVALWFVDELASRQLKVVLSGEGADELFGGYRIYREPNSLAPFRILSPKMKKITAKKVGDMKRDFKGKNYILRGCSPLEKRFIGNARIFSADEKKRILCSGNGSEPGMVTRRVYHDNRHLDDISRMQEIDLNFWLPGDILLKADKMSMAHSLESRVPYLDREVYEAARTLAVKDKVKGKQTKVLFRKVASGEVPEITARKKKLGFPVPIRVWLRMPEYYEKVRKAFSSPAACRYFRIAELERLLTEHLHGEKDNSRKIWTVYMFLVWYQVYFGY